MKIISNALLIRRRVFGAFEVAESATDSGRTEPLANVRPRRHRATGVELVGQIREMATPLIRRCRSAGIG